MKEIKLKGKRVPQDIALVGFTDEFHATIVEPNLTAITHPTSEIGKEAFGLLLQEINSKNRVTPQQVIMNATLIPRKSSQKIMP